MEFGESVRPVRVKIKLCDDFLSRTVGALAEGRINYRDAYLFPSGSSIHTFFMRSSISVLTYNKNGSIVDYRSSIPPFRVFMPGRSARGLIEMAPDRLNSYEDKLDSASVLFDGEIADSISMEHLSRSETDSF